MVKRIVFISIFQKDYGGGEGRVAHEMASYIAQHYNTAIICPGPKNHLYRDENGLVVFNVQSAGKENFVMPLLSPQNIRNIFEFLDGFEPDVVHAHDPALLGIIGQLWANQHNVPFFFTSHVIPSNILDFGASDALRISAGPLTESVIEDYLLTFYNHCSAVIALNRTIHDAIREFGSNVRLFTIPNGRHLQRYLTFGYTYISSTPKTISFVGFITPRKNQIYLLRMLKYLPRDYRLYLIGSFLSPAYEKEIKQFVVENKLDNVIFTGEVKHDEIPRYLYQSHLMVSASKMEVQSLVIIEALAAGTPVVGLSNETIDELVDDSTGKWLPKDTPPEDFAAAVQAICSLPQDAYQQLCQNARQRVSGLDWKNIMDKTVQVYTQLIREKEKTSPVDQTWLLQSISRVPPGVVRDTLMQKVVAPLYTTIRESRRVTSKERLFAGLTAIGSMLIYMTLKGPVFVLRKLKIMGKTTHRNAMKSKAQNTTD